tara:strand:+ start:340 stop:921 length:582 start_codon:yes stop_codon:yes gene_type:complete
MSNKLVNDTNINKKVDKIAKEQNVSNVNLTMLGLDASKKLISVIDAKGKFILAVIQIGKYILTNLQGKFGPCINKQKNKWIEITQDSLLLVEKIGDTLDVECIPAGVLGILTTMSILPEIQKYIPGINIPFLDMNIPAIQPIISNLKQIYESINFSGIFNINIQELLTPTLLLCLMNLGEKDYCYNLVTKDIP